MSFPGGSAVKNLSANAVDMGLIPGLKIYLGRENSNSLQYSCLGNLMDRETWQTVVYGVADNNNYIGETRRTK